MKLISGKNITQNRRLPRTRLPHLPGGLLLGAVFLAGLIVALLAANTEAQTQESPPSGSDHSPSITLKQHD
ncbi:MAG: hypothetical protein ACYC9S_09495, partial [Leptospirales bacterium]